MNEKEVSLVEQLRSIPKDYRTTRAIQWAEDGTETGHQFIPVGLMMHRAADKIDKLRELAQDYLDAVDRDSVSQSDDEYIKEQALKEALKNE